MVERLYDEHEDWSVKIAAAHNATLAAEYERGYRDDGFQAVAAKPGGKLPNYCKPSTRERR